MNTIKIYCSNKDIRIKGIINHFMRCLGLYVVEIYEEENNNIDSICDIYVISKYCKLQSIDVKNESKSILVLADGYDTDEQDQVIKKVYYEDSDMEEFLTNLIYEMGDILEGQKLLEKRLIYEDSDYLYIIYKIIDKYTRNKIFESSVYMRYYFSDEELFMWSIPKYENFINELQEWNTKKNSDLIEYTILNSMYEADIMCKKNSYELLYSTENILQRCRTLLQRYESNEEVRLLIADTYNEFLEFGAKATNEYGSVYLEHCSYAHYKRGRAFRKYVGDMRSADISIKNALKLNKFYYNAWYQNAMCYAYIEDFEGESESLFNIFRALKDKWNENILSPLELEYLYKSLGLLKQISDDGKFRLLGNSEYKKMEDSLDVKCLTSKYAEYMGILQDDSLSGVGYRNIEKLSSIKDEMCIA